MNEAVEGAKDPFMTPKYRIASLLASHNPMFGQWVDPEYIGQILRRKGPIQQRFYL